MARVITRKKLDELRRSLLERLKRGANACDLFDEAQEIRSEMQNALESIVDECQLEARDTLRPSEAREFAELRDGISTLDPVVAHLKDAALRQEGRHPDQLAALRAASQREADEARANFPQGENNVTTSRLTVTSEPTTYGPESRHSYFHDLATRQTGDSAAARRLERHAAEIATDAPREVRAMSTADGSGSEWVPPMWLLSQYAGLARPGRVTADLFRTQQLPPGTDSINVPRVTQGVAVSAQSSQNTVLVSQDMTTDTVTAAVNTYGGYVDVSVQLFEQSPIAGGLDQVIFNDLVRAHAQTINGACLYGSGANGQIEGIFTNTSTTAITYTATSPTAGGLYSALASAISSVSTSRYEPPTAVVMHPRRWAWLMAQTDTTGRPLVVPTADLNQSVNALAPADDYGFTAPVGRLHGLPVWLDPMIPTTTNTNQDRIIVAKFSDAFAYEGGVKTEVFREPLSSSLGLRFRLYSYFASTGPKRYPGSFAIIGGTGLAATV